MLGSFPRGATIATNISIQNPRDSEVAVLDLSTSCGCVATDFSPRKLLPGEEMIVEVELHTQDKQDRVVEHVRFFSTDTGLNRTTISLVADIRENAGGVQPTSLVNLGTYRSEDGVAFELTIPLEEYGADEVSGLHLIQQKRVISALNWDVGRVRWERGVLHIPIEIPPSSDRGLVEGLIRVHFSDSDGHGRAEYYFDHELVGTALPFLQFRPSHLLPAVAARGEAQIFEIWSELGEDIEFPSNSGISAGVEWELDLNDHAESEFDELSAIARVQVPDDGSDEARDLAIPFRIHGNDYSLVIPFRR